MANLQIKDAAASTKYVKATGTGATDNPFVPEHLETNSAAILTAAEAIQVAVEAVQTAIDGTIDVAVASLPLPSGAATAANQSTANTSLAAIQSSLGSALPLPTGAATAENQTTANTFLSTIATSVAGATPAGENVIGAVGGKSSLVTPTVTVSTSPAYASGDSIGGKITISNAMRVSNGTGYLQSLMILDRANQKPTGTILIFNADPSAATITDNAAFVFSTDDTKIVAAITILTSDYTTINSKAIANKTGLGAAVKAASGTTLYAAFVTTSTPTFSATTDLQIVFGFLQD